jgi:hypothetical protein
MTFVLLKNLIQPRNPNRNLIQPRNPNRSRIPTRNQALIWSRIQEISRAPEMSPVPERKEIETRAMATRRTVTMRITLVGAVLKAWDPREDGATTEVPMLPGGTETPATIEAPGGTVTPAIMAVPGGAEIPVTMEAARGGDRKQFPGLKFPVFESKIHPPSLTPIEQLRRTRNSRFKII